MLGVIAGGRHSLCVGTLMKMSGVRTFGRMFMLYRSKGDPMRIVVASLLLAALAVCITGCNTVEGAGKDTKNAGQSIENAADRNK